MPPKKEEEPVVPVVVWTVLPVVVNSKLAEEALKKPVTIKKVLDRSKLIQLLKDKGIEKYQNQGKLNREGELFLCQNLETVGQEFLLQSRKPADPKKDQKKDTKKDTKKEQTVVQQTEKPLEFDFDKAVTEFLFYLDIPLDPEALKVSTEKGLKPEVVVWIQEKIKEGSEIPSYDILNNQRTIEDFINQMNSTAPNNINKEKQSKDLSQEQVAKKEILKFIQNLRMKKDSTLENTIIISVPFQKDLQHPETDSQTFLKALFKRLCELSLKRESFTKWIGNQRKSPMIPPIKETIKKEVVVEEKKDEKKGGKKDPNAQPVTEIIEEVVEKRYESFPQNIKSDLSVYQKISRQRKHQSHSSKYYNILDDLALSISIATEPVPKNDYKTLGESIRSKAKEKPLNRIDVSHLKNKLPEVLPSSTCSELSYKVNFTPYSLPSQVSLLTILKRNPDKKSLQHQYKLQQFTNLSNKLGDRIFFTFDKRQYVQQLDPTILNSRINQELEFDPKIYCGDCPDDGYSLLILARINPPGRVMYYNNIFDWKVFPNFQFWEEKFKDENHETPFWDYDWRDAGNLKILSKKMMPTDNTVISENLLTCGDTESRLITLTKDDIQYGLHELKGGNHLFWKKTSDIKTSIFTQKGKDTKQGQQIEMETCIQEQEFSVFFNPLPIIYWKHHPLQESRSFGPKGEISKRLKDGTIEVLYPNGDISELKFGKWKHIKNDQEFVEGSEERKLKVDFKIDADKKIVIREDSTVFVTYPTSDRSIIFKDGTIVRKIGKNKLLIKNPGNFVVRINLGRKKDFNVIGSGSAFAYLGFSNLLERTYDGELYEVFHPSFSWHAYHQGVDRSGRVNQQKVVMIAYPDNSMIKLGSDGLLTFLNSTSETKEEMLNERWIQLFTAAEYHLEGVYDVDLIKGELITKDAESNCFRVKVDGTGKTKIAVSFNIGGLKEEKNTFGQGLHIPEQNYFLPPPQNCITPRLFIIYPDGRGEEYMTEEQISELKCWKEVKESVGTKKIVQYSREATPPSLYFPLSFSEKINLSLFSLPNLIEGVSTRPNNIRYQYNSIYFRSLEELEWERDFSRIKSIRQNVVGKRKELKEEIQALRQRIKT